MKAKLLSFTLFCFTMVGLYAQTVTRTENFSNYAGTSPYAGVPVGSSQIVWNIQVGSLGTLNGNALILGKDGTATAANVPHGIANDIDFSLYVTNDNNQDCSLNILINDISQGTISIEKKTTNVLHTLSITDVQYSDFTLEIRNTSGGNRPLTIDDVSWSGYSSIREIQYTTIPGDGTYPSPEEGNIFTLFGTVTGVIPGSGYYIQDEDGFWNGIWVDDSSLSPARLDEVAATGTVTENAGRTELSSVTTSSIVGVNTGVEPTAELIYEPISESYESVVSYIAYSRYATGGSGNLFMNIGFDAPLTPIKIDNDLFTMADPNVNNLYTIYGPVNYEADEFSISPRDVADVADEGVITINQESIIENPTITASLSSIVVESGNVFSIQVYNLAGQRVKDLNGLEGRNEISLAKGVYVVKVNTANTTTTEKVLVK